MKITEMVEQLGRSIWRIPRNSRNWDPVGGGLHQRRLLDKGFRIYIYEVSLEDEKDYSAERIFNFYKEALVHEIVHAVDNKYTCQTPEAEYIAEFGMELLLYPTEFDIEAIDVEQRWETAVPGYFKGTSMKKTKQQVLNDALELLYDKKEFFSNVLEQLDDLLMNAKEG